MALELPYNVGPSPLQKLSEREVHEALQQVQENFDWLAARFPLQAADIASGTAWTKPNFENTWAQYTDATYGTATYRYGADGLIHLRGAVMHTAAGAAGTTIFTLPLGYRPSKHQLWPVMTSNGIERVRVSSDGKVNYEGVAGTVAWLFLDPIHFYPD